VSQEQRIVEDEEQPAVQADPERAYEIGRLMAFSDGVFAIAITLLVLNVPVPDIPQAEATSRLPAALLDTGPRLLTFALSFFLVGFYWIRHHQLFRRLIGVDVWLLWLNLVVLFLVCLLPFSSGVVGRYANAVVGAEVYAVNLALIALSFTAMSGYATRDRLVHVPPGTVTGLFRRGFLWPLAVVGLVMVLAPISLTIAYAIGVTLMAAVSVYTAVPRVVRSAPLAVTGAGRLRFPRPAARVTLRADSNMAELFRARLTGPEPTVTVTGNAIDIEYRGVRAFGWRRQAADIALNTSIPWRVDADAGVAYLTADLRGLRLTAVSISGAASRLDLRLPRPSGTVPIHIRDGAANVSIRRPAGVAVRAVVPDGAASVQFDELRIGPIDSQTPIQSPDYDGATDRYDVEGHGGLARLIIAKG
jgi:uncharacterized membrane protein